MSGRQCLRVMADICHLEVKRFPPLETHIGENPRTSHAKFALMLSLTYPVQLAYVCLISVDERQIRDLWGWKHKR
ncbi:hypothetical protein ACTXT7_008038 [Hymenolepis weldensis]